MASDWKSVATCTRLGILARLSNSASRTRLSAVGGIARSLSGNRFRRTQRLLQFGLRLVLLIESTALGSGAGATGAFSSLSAMANRVDSLDNGKESRHRICRCSDLPELGNPGKGARVVQRILHPALTR